MNSPSPSVSKREKDRILRQSKRNQEERSQEEDSCRSKNQDFVAPAPYPMSIEVVGVRVRQHQHKERTPASVVSWTAAERDTVGILRRNERD
jgi:hypothetical protein